MKKIITPKSWGHNSVPLKQFQRYTIILESGDTIVYPHTNQYPTLYIIWIYLWIYGYIYIWIYINGYIYI